MKKWQSILVNNIAGSSLIPVIIRSKIYKLCGIDIETNVFFSGIYFQSNKVKVGKGSWVNRNCYFDDHVPIIIGKNVGIGMEAMFCTTTHNIGEEAQRAGDAVIRLPIVIEDGCWIGARATILAGVTVGKGSIIAAGAVVNKSCEPNGLYAGVPARRIKELT